MTAASPRLLVVEDEDHLAAGLKLNFELEGYAIDLASTARRAPVEAPNRGRFLILFHGPVGSSIRPSLMRIDARGTEHACRVNIDCFLAPRSSGSECRSLALIRYWHQ